MCVCPPNAEVQQRANTIRARPQVAPLRRSPIGCNATLERRRDVDREQLAGELLIGARWCVLNERPNRADGVRASDPIIGRRVCPFAHFDRITVRQNDIPGRDAVAVGSPRLASSRPQFRDDLVKLLGILGTWPTLESDHSPRVVAEWLSAKELELDQGRAVWRRQQEVNTVPFCAAIEAWVAPKQMTNDVKAEHTFIPVAERHARDFFEKFLARRRYRRC
jgi:hypothetical protein